MTPSLSRIGRLIREPRDLLALINGQMRLRGRAHIPANVRLWGRARVFGSGKVSLGDGVALDGSIVPIEFRTYAGGQIIVGAQTFINYGSSIAAHLQVTIGEHCHLGHYTFIIDNNQHQLAQHLELPPSKPVVIEDNVWIGSHVIVLPGVRIGSRAVVGAGSVVTKDVTANCLVAGNPLRIIRKLG